MGVYIAPIEHYLGWPAGRLRKWEGEWDCVSMSCGNHRAAAQLQSHVLSCSAETNGIITRVRWAAAARQPRPVCNQEGLSSFSGYAHAQFKKISFNQEAQALMRELEQQLLRLDIDPESTTDGHALRLPTVNFRGATTE